MLTLSVPPTARERHHWQAQSDGMTGRRRLTAASGPYESALPARIADLELTLPPALAADIDEATAALSRFDDYARMSLGPASTTLGPMSSILLRTESASSSQIEQLTAGARQLALAELEQGSSQNARIVMGNVRAMEAALDLAEKLDQEAILAMQRILVEEQPASERYAGRYRDSLVWVGTSAVSPIGASHIAPQAKYIGPAMADLVRFMDRLDLPTLLQAALAHAQFETIHPFKNGNGRTGRALVHALLKARGLVTTTTAPLSAGLLKQTPTYFRALTTYREGEAAPLVTCFTEAALFAASSGTQLVDDLSAELEASAQAMQGLRRQASAWKVLPHLVAHPVINAAFLERRLGLNQVAAQRALSQLVDRRVIEERSGLKRNRVYQHEGILRILDAYAQQLRRG